MDPFSRTILQGSESDEDEDNQMYRSKLKHTKTEKKYNLTDTETEQELEWDETIEQLQLTSDLNTPETNMEEEQIPIALRQRQLFSDASEIDYRDQDTDDDIVDKPRPSRLLTTQQQRNTAP